MLAPSTGRGSRGNHSVKPLNPNPIYVKPKNRGRLPGILNTCEVNAKNNDVTKHPLFIKAVRVAGIRMFSETRRKAINAAFQLLVARHDLLSKTIVITIEQMAKELSKELKVDEETGEEIILDSEMTLSRMYNLMNDVFIKLNILNVTFSAYDKKHGMCFPKVMEVTDLFYGILNANMKKLDKQIESRLHYRNVANPGDIVTVSELKARAAKRILDRSWELRLKNSNASKKRAKLTAMSVEERLYEAAKAVAKRKTQEELASISPEAFKKECWRYLSNLESDIFHAPPEQIQ